MDYESTDVTIEALDGRGDHVVMMGEEVREAEGDGSQRR
jgi:hypothetical protein